MTATERRFLHGISVGPAEYGVDLKPELDKMAARSMGEYALQYSGDELDKTLNRYAKELRQLRRIAREQRAREF